MKRIRVLIADDQILFAGSLKIVLEGHGSGDIEVVGVAYNGKEAIEIVERKHPHVVLMDVRMPVMDGVSATKYIVDHYSDVKVMMLTTFDDDDYVHDALKNGAIGYILKNIEPDELANAIKSIRGGTFLISPSVGKRLFAKSERQFTKDKYPISMAELNFLRAKFPQLSRREVEVLGLIMKHRDNHEIAEKLFIAEQTVKNYTSRLYAKMGVKDRLHAIQLAKEIQCDPSPLVTRGPLTN